VRVRAAVAASFYVIVGIVAVLNEALGVPIVAPASATFVAPTEGAPIVDYDSQKQLIFAQIFRPWRFSVGKIFGLRPIILSQFIVNVLRGDNRYVKEFVVRFDANWLIRRASAAYLQCGAYIFNDSRRLAVICNTVGSENLPKTGRAIGVDFKLTSTEYENVRPLQCRECFVGSIQEGISGAPQEDSRDKQKAREQADEKTLVFVHVADEGRHHAPIPQEIGWR
jgi:hypothetical protein